VIAITLRHLGPGTHPGGTPQSVHGKEGASVHEDSPVYVAKGSLVETLVKAGGEEWRKGDAHRVYFPDIERLYGMEYNYMRNTCQVNGEQLDRQQTQDLMGDMSKLKFWYDVNRKKFEVGVEEFGRGGLKGNAESYLAAFKSGLKKKVEALK